MTDNVSSAEGFSSRAINIVLAIIVTLLVLVPVVGSIGGIEHTIQEGTSMSLASGNLTKDLTGDYSEGTPIIISDVFNVTYTDTYEIRGKSINVEADSIKLVKSGNEVQLNYMIDGSENEYYATVSWIFIYDESGTYSATSEAQDINVNADKSDEIYVVGAGQFDTFWSYYDGTTKVVREI